MPQPSARELLEVDDVSKLQAEVRRTGGRLILYKTVFSLIFVSTTSPRVVCIEPGESRKFMGALASFSTFVFGWWSLQGFAWTLIALVWNFRGGVDVTDALMPDEFLPAEDSQVWIRRVDQFDTRARVIGFSIVAIPILVFLVYLSLANR
jgi:hypothetical protein